MSKKVDRKAGLTLDVPPLLQRLGQLHNPRQLQKMTIGLAYRVAGMSETVVHGETGLLVGQESPDSLAEGILTLLDDEDLIRPGTGESASPPSSI